MDYLSLIKQPIEAELNDFIELFNQSRTSVIVVGKGCVLS